MSNTENKNNVIAVKKLSLSIFELKKEIDTNTIENLEEAKKMLKKISSSLNKIDNELLKINNIKFSDKEKETVLELR